MQRDKYNSRYCQSGTDRDDLPDLEIPIVKIRLAEMTLHHPRQFGACWLALHLWHTLDFDAFWKPRLPPSREGTHWLNVLKTLVAYRLIDPGSEWRLHRQWLDDSAMPDLLGDQQSLFHKDNYYRCLDKLLPHKDDMFSFLQPRWENLFGETYDILLYDLTSTYFECDPPENIDGFKRKEHFGDNDRPFREQRIRGETFCETRNVFATTPPRHGA